MIYISPSIWPKESQLRLFGFTYQKKLFASLSNKPLIKFC